MSDPFVVDPPQLDLLLKQLRLPTMRALWRSFTERADRERRRFERHRAEAKLPPGKTLETFDFTLVPAVSKARVRVLASGDVWLGEGANVLLFGPPGTGKTLSASVLAGELDQTRGVYFFDEFDAIGSERGIANDVGEIRRVLNSFLQMIEQDDSHSIVMAATNHPGILDRALFRRFDDILHFEMPDIPQIAELLKMRLGPAASRDIAWSDLAGWAVGLSFADVARATNDVLKDALVGQRERIQEEEIRAVIDELKAARGRLAEQSA